MRKKSSYFFSAKKMLEMFGIFAQLRKTVLVLCVNLGLSARVSQYKIRIIRTCIVYTYYTLYTRWPDLVYKGQYSILLYVYKTAASAHR